MDVNNNNNGSSGALVLIAFFLIGMAQALNARLPKSQQGGSIDKITKQLRSQDLSGLKSQIMKQVPSAGTMANIKGNVTNKLNDAKSKAKDLSSSAKSKVSSSPAMPEGLVGDALAALTWGFETAKSLAEGASKQALAFADARVGMLMDAITGGTENKTLKELTPQINKTLRELSEVLQDLANTPQSRVLLERFAQSLTESAITMIDVAAPNMEKIATVAANTAGRVGSIAARRGIGAGMTVVKSAIAMIPGVNVAFFSSLLLISTITGVIRVALNATNSATQIADLVSNAITKASQKAEGPVGKVASTGRAIVDRAQSLMNKQGGAAKSRKRRNRKNKRKTTRRNRTRGKRHN